MLFDLGLERKLFENSTMISRAIKILDKDFNLILITDHFDELMVLLKRRLCWNIEDVAYLTLHVRKPLKRRVRTKTEISKLEKWNSADVLLYDHFLKKSMEGGRK